MMVVLLTYIEKEQIAFLHILGSVIGLIIFLWVGIRISRWLRPQNTYVEKLTTYESGSEPTGYAQGPIHSQLHIVGLIFLLFEVETILLIPWALAWVEKDIEQLAHSLSSLYMAILGTFFILVLGLGLVYVLSKWKNIEISSTLTIPQHHHTNPVDPILSMYYEKINAQYSGQSPSLSQRYKRK